MNKSTEKGSPIVLAADARISGAGKHQGLVRQIDRGIHVTFLLSVLAMPVGYLTQVVLARTSQDAVGIYGGILLWVMFTSCFYYFGGNAVLIKFLPEMAPEDRPAFLLSYGGLILGLTLVGMLPVALGRTFLGSLLGPGVLKYAVPVLLLIALINIFLQFLLSALKALLELSAAQVLGRISTMGYLLSFGTLLFLGKPWFRAHLLTVIVVVHVAVVAFSLLAAVFYLIRHLRPGMRSVRWYLPRGFWRFSLATELSSIVNFFYSHLAQLLVLIYASISGLGIYFVVAQLAAAIQLISGFFLEGILPAFANILPRLGKEATRSVYYRGARINQVIVTSCALLLICFHAAILSIFGDQYRNYWPVLVALAVFSGINSLGTLNSYLLTGASRMGLLLSCQALPVVVFLTLFPILGGKDSLFMLALAQGFAMTAGLITTIVVTTYNLRFGLRVPREFWASLVILLVATGLAFWAGPLSFASALSVYVVAQTAFFVFGGYHWPEIQSLLLLLRLPGRGRGDQVYPRVIFWADSQATSEKLGATALGANKTRISLKA